MITPRQFEEKAAEIIEKYENDPGTMSELIIKLMADTLDTWGYKTDKVRQDIQQIKRRGALN